MARLRFQYGAISCDIEVSDFNRPVVEVNTDQRLREWLLDRETRFTVVRPDRYVFPIADMIQKVREETQIELSDDTTELSLRGIMSPSDGQDWGKEIVFQWTSCEWSEEGEKVLSVDVPSNEFWYRGVQYSTRR